MSQYKVQAMLLKYCTKNFVFSIFSNLTGKRLKNIKDSAVSDHLLQCNCAMDFDHFDILATDLSKFNPLVKEILLIRRDNPVLNRTTKSFPLELFD